MEKKWIIYLFVMLISLSVHAQADPGIFDRISRGVSDYRLDNQKAESSKQPACGRQVRNEHKMSNE